MVEHDMRIYSQGRGLMKAKDTNVLRLMSVSGSHFVVPIYQRDYSWTVVECAQLWKDILAVGSSDDTTSHFVGSIVYVGPSSSPVTGIDSLLVIDGQQRLTTVMLLIVALCRALGDSEPVAGFSAAKLGDRYLLNAHEDGDNRYKLVLNAKDRDTFNALVDKRTLPVAHSQRLVESFEFLKGRIAALGDDVEQLCIGLGRLAVVDVALDPKQDNPQLIFESMNSTGKRLTPSDMIRNYVLMGLEPAQQTELWTDYWRPMEVLFGQGSYAEEFNKFMRHYLTFRTGEIPNVSAVYEAFKTYAGLRQREGGSVESLVTDVRKFAEHYCVMAGLKRATDPRMEAAVRDLREFRVDVAFPFLLELYEDFANDLLDSDGLLGIVRLVESYVFRRAICSMPTNSLNKTFANLGRSVDKKRYFASVCEQLMGMPSYRRFPRDEEFKRKLIARDLYNFPRRNYWLRRLENHDRKDPVLMADYTVEHIMPQNDNLSEAWQAELGVDEWRRVHVEYLHTLGNLTLTAYNSEMGDRPFNEKRDMVGGFAQSHLRLNEGLGNVKKWNEQAIKDRAAKLADRAQSVWSGPPAQFSDGLTAVASGVTDAKQIERYEFLSRGGVTRTLFEALRGQILALDACVTEEFLKRYVAYKAETNFVDVVPQATGLQLTLNMSFADLDDPKGLSSDVTGVGRWGNGDVAVRLTELEEVPYVISLVRQSLERQMADWDLSPPETSVFADDLEISD